LLAGLLWLIFSQ
jgi:hypothetical protein